MARTLTVYFIRRNIMKTLFVLLFLSISYGPFSLATSSNGYQKPVSSTFETKKKIWNKKRLQAVLKNSVFNNQPESLANGYITNYDPALIAVAASLYSRLPARDDTQFEQQNLPPLIRPYLDSPCPNSMKVYVKKSKQKNPYTFVLLPGAYATWKRGSFNNQTIAVLNKKFNDPNIIGFDGYLSPAFLEGTCDKIPWNAKAIAEDIRARLRYMLVSALNGLKATPEKTGLIGHSGGASLVVAMLAKDATEVIKHKTEAVRLFGLGGMSFSPVLHALSTYHNLDESVKTIPHDRGISTLDLSQISFLAGAFLEDFSLDWRDMVDLYDSDPQNYLERYTNEVYYPDLRGTLKAINMDLTDLNKEELSYYNIYVNTGFKNDMPTSIIGNLSKENLDLLHNYTLDSRPLLEAIDRPLLIYFSQDDTIISSYDNSGQPEVVTAILSFADKKPDITVFNPEYGGHIGHFFDPIFENLLHAFFTPTD